jgi:succinylglutamate desuccinylase
MPTLTPDLSPVATERPRGERSLGRYATGRPGPTVVVTAGLHGNEPAGTVAFGRVLDRLESGGLPLRGCLLGLAGNTRALARGERFLSRDLNRRWSPDELARTLPTGADGLSDEDLEQRELLQALAPILAPATAPVVFLDLHSTSGAGAPFVVMADVLRNRPVAFALPIPLVLGLEEFVDGSMLGYLCDLGHVGVAVEGGQHGEPSTVDHHEAAIWLALAASGALAPREVPEASRWKALLEGATRGLPRVVEIRHRHRVDPEDDYRMLPGFRNFSPVAAGQHVATDRTGPVKAPERGVLMLPRYQSQGEDGYFLARRVSRFWLGVSRVLRVARVDRLAPRLPGVQRHPALPDHHVVDPRVARFFVTDLFHLLGYRRIRMDGGRPVFSRRRPDHGGVAGLPRELAPIAPGAASI